MNQAIRSAWVVAVALFILVVGSLSYVQFFDQFRGSDALANNDLNQRTVMGRYCGERGAILVGGQAIAESVPSGDSCKFVRKYTDAPLYAGVTGFYSLNFGKTGIEKAMDQELTGDAPELFYDRISQLLSGSQPRGSSVTLTIDPKIQALAYQLLPDDIPGSIVVTNPKTGAILAMVSKPSYDTNEMASHNYKQVDQNFAQLTKVPNINMYGSAAYARTYAPGSVFKLVDTAAALKSGKYNKDSVLPNPAQLSFPGTSVTLPNYRLGRCDSQTEASFAFALAQSCNTPFASIAADIGQKAITEQAEKFGFNQNAPTLPSGPVATSVFPGPNAAATDTQLGAADLARSSIGQQNVQVTPLQVAMMTGAIANNGIEMKPTLIQNVLTPDLKPVSNYNFKPEQLRTSLSPDVAKQMTEWMTGVVDNGIASQAAIPGVKVAAKTGTAEGDLSNPDAPKNSWFTGFAPADDPQVVVTILVQTPDIIRGGSLTSPNAKKLIEAVLNK